MGRVDKSATGSVKLSFGRHAVDGSCHDRSVVWRVDPEGVETRSLMELAPLEGLRVLELGCGDGRLTWWLAHSASSVVAVEIDEERLAAARASVPADLAAKIELIAASATEVDLPPGEFELALFSWSL